MALSTFQLLALALIILAPIGAKAQTAAPPATASNAQLLKPAELDQLVAPIALYPDPLLAEVLMASTYPLDLVQAERWAEANKNLKGDQLKAAADKQAWDQSVKSLVATPDVLAIAIQRLRAKAQANNKLTSTKEQTVGFLRVHYEKLGLKFESYTATVNVRINATGPASVRENAPRRTQPLRFRPAWANATTAENPPLNAPEQNDAGQVPLRPAKRYLNNCRFGATP